MSPSESRRLTVVITGVTRGLGRAMVDEFARLGHLVVGCARTRDEIEALSRVHASHDFQVVNVGSDVAVAAWAQRVENKYGPADFVLNNAAVLNEKASLWEVPASEFAELVKVNIQGVVNVIRHFAPGMIRSRRGTIVNFSSRWGTTFEKRMAPYCATKWAVVALTRGLADELKSEGVIVVAINPGIVKTGMLQRYLGSSVAVEATPYPSPAEWAKIAVPKLLRLRPKNTGKSINILKHRRSVDAAQWGESSIPGFGL